MNGAPALSGTAGALINMLNACLVDGFAAVTVNSLTISNNIATAIVSTGHNLSMITGVNNVTPGVGPVVRVSGASPATINADWRVASIPNASTLTFTTAGIADQAATGTITLKRAPLGYSRLYSGSNKEVYVRSAPQATTMLLRVQDDQTTNALVAGYESMTDVDTGTGVFPAATTYLYKGFANSTARPWALIGDGQSLYCITRQLGGYVGGLFFGDLSDPIEPGKAYACAIIAGSQNTDTALGSLLQTANAALARSYTALPGAAPLLRYAHPLNGSTFGGGGHNQFPAPDGSFHGTQVEAWESNTLYRGILPGVYSGLHNNTIPAGTLIDAIPQLAGHSLLALTIGASRQALFDLTGPWR